MSTPNVFLLVVDSLRADAVFGGDVSTPNIDIIGAGGRAFHQCVCTTTTTTPSFSSMLTGCWPPRHGVRGLQGYRLSRDLTTLPEAMAKAGYATYAEVTGPLLPETGVLRGFDQATHRPAYRVPFFGWRTEIVERMRSFTAPWFMLLHIWEVHRPYRSPPDFKKRKDKAGYEAAVAATDEWLAPVFEAAGDNAILVITGDHGEEYPSTALQFQGVRAARKSRRALRLARWLPALDNRFAGLEIGHGFALHEPLVRVPLVIAGPGVAAGDAIDDQVRHIDLLPTLTDLCGIEPPDRLDGRSLVPLIQGGKLPEEPAYMEAVGVKLGGDRIVGVRTPEWKLLRAKSGKQSLIDLRAPKLDEKRSVHERFPEVTRRLESWLAGVERSEAASGSGLSHDDEAVIEKNLRDLGYL